MSFDLGPDIFRGPVWKKPTDGGVGRKKPKSVKRASPARWRAIRAAKLGPCVVCLVLGETQTLDSTLHHVVSKSLGGSDTEANLVSVCGDGTTGHHGDIEAHRPEICQAFATGLQLHDDAAYAYAVDKLGEDGFLRRYHVKFRRAA